MSRYEDIIHLPHHVSRKHPQMSLKERAAQFSPFAALTGHSAATEEAARLTAQEAVLDETETLRINEQLAYLKKNLSDAGPVLITYFQEDERKEGGAYVTAQSLVRKIDEYRQTVVLQNGMIIRMEHIRQLEIPSFSADGSPERMDDGTEMA